MERRKYIATTGAALALGLAGCGSGGNGDGNGNGSGTTDQQSLEDFVALLKSYCLDNFSTEHLLADRRT